jgi:hypothetical protein
MKKGKYSLVLEIIESYEDEMILNSFLEEFEEGKDISRDKYDEFCMRFIDDVSEEYYIRLNWKYIISGGDESVYDEKI